MSPNLRYTDSHDPYDINGMLKIPIVKNLSLASTKVSVSEKLSLRCQCKSIEKLEDFNLESIFDDLMAKYNQESIFEKMLQKPNIEEISKETIMNAYLKNYLLEFFDRIQKSHCNDGSTITYNDLELGEPDILVICHKHKYVTEMKLEQNFCTGSKFLAVSLVSKYFFSLK